MLKIRNKNKMKVSDMERDLLRVVYIHGQLRLDVVDDDPAQEWLGARYDIINRDISRRLSHMLNYLAEQRYLWPSFDANRKLEISIAADITPKGLERLYELEHPVQNWLRRNWFPATVATATILAVIISPVVAWMLTRGSVPGAG